MLFRFCTWNAQEQMAKRRSARIPSSASGGGSYLGRAKQAHTTASHTTSRTPLSPRTFISGNKSVAGKKTLWLDHFQPVIHTQENNWKLTAALVIFVAVILSVFWFTVEGKLRSLCSLVGREVKWFNGGSWGGVGEEMTHTNRQRFLN